ncbi:hypothetical protein BATDEDRAFT_10423 [Batrachochytrium dendrobatidis JAM81]|uniref:Ribosomal protein n=2 Tax=Batrachochytrium dendrobatidis TaxID=109871 RepID=F4NZN0_BATDJ|nr:uncharacterized protein BATDEDRAFT_10423 [Batrachochytrium dendrobatidis JAM81]EGF81211.1 hypothetical protein BATDEDRAFT_10423 [Batrachochytrium dendrobatidis JAM81]KAJ8325979.1 hypothetical protein O5D80_005620 [Batrachochytrium dendrobatidis]KAK5669758.1 hypothetical protein QVD99_004142 [Batrachochytrium dendrobatidis]OAJ38287.1 ribosomal protein L36 [Batrachochytrium dendrobatidis JEL423]|eukprot:XP_006677719.1 hypothetical protein BATDEDRAFT_10423 [Batrachochytrium dendrobatidis JAM81]
MFRLLKPIQQTTASQYYKLAVSNLFKQSQWTTSLLSRSITTSPLSSCLATTTKCPCGNHSSALVCGTTSFVQSTIRTYKIKTALRRRCEHCYFVARKGKLRIVCPENGKHKQRQP